MGVGKASRFRRSFLWVFGIVLFILTLFPLIPGSSSYGGIGPAQGKRLSVSFFDWRPYIVQEDGIYLLEMRTTTALCLTTGIRRKTWSEEELLALRGQFPELVPEAFVRYHADDPIFCWSDCECGAVDR